MIAMLRAPERLDQDRAAPWLAHPDDRTGNVHVTAVHAGGFIVRIPTPSPVPSGPGQVPHGPGH